MDRSVVRNTDFEASFSSALCSFANMTQEFAVGISIMTQVTFRISSSFISRCISPSDTSGKKICRKTVKKYKNLSEKISFTELVARVEPIKSMDRGVVIPPTAEIVSVRAFGNEGLIK